MSPGVDDTNQDKSETGVSPKPVARVGTFSSLGIRNFRFLLTGTILSNAGQWIQQVTLSWLVYNLTGSGTILGTMNVVRSAASLSMIPLAGMLIDRGSRRRIMMLTNGWLFTITATMGVLLLLGHSNLALLFIFAFLGGLVQTIDGTLRQVLVFDLVPRSHAPNGVALIQTGWSLMRSFGPAIGGFLILWFGPSGNFFVQAGAYVLIMVTIFGIRFPGRSPGGVRTSPLQNIREGISYVARHKVTRTFMFMGFILPLFIIPIYGILPPIYAVAVFHGDSGTLGLLLGSIGVGGILGWGRGCLTGQIPAPRVDPTGFALYDEHDAGGVCLQHYPVALPDSAGNLRLLRDDLPDHKPDTVAAFDT